MSTSREPSPIYALSEADFAPLATAAESPSEVFTPRTSPSPLETYWSNRKEDLQVVTDQSSSSSEPSTPPWICESSSNGTIGAHNLNVSGTPHGPLGSDSSGLLEKLYQQHGSPTSALGRQVGGRHYKDFKIQPVEFIYQNNIGFIEGSIIKYICRFRAKAGVQDLEKIKHYIELLIELEKAT